MILISFITATVLGMFLKKQDVDPDNSKDNKEKDLVEDITNNGIEIEDVGSDGNDDNGDDDDEDDCSETSNSDEDEDGMHNRNAIVLSDNNADGTPKFGNICVTNSNEVHFGNKTFYQGPVTIKQFLYANNAALECDGIGNGKLAINDSPIIANNIAEVHDNDRLANDKQANRLPINNVSANHDDNIKKHSKLSKGIEWARKHLVLISGLSLLVVVTTATLVTVLVYKEYNNAIGIVEESSELEDADLTKPHIDPNRPVTLGGKLKIVGRKEWVAQPPQKPINKLNVPVPYVIIMHTATDRCFNQGDCTFIVRQVQSFHIDGRKWNDIGYNFLVGGDGYVYEGRGWTNEGAHTLGYNTVSMGIAFVGTFNDVLPTTDQMKACQLLIKKGVDSGYIQENYSLFAATQLSQTQSPGLMLTEELKKWPHFALTPNKAKR